MVEIEFKYKDEKRKEIKVDACGRFPVNLVADVALGNITSMVLSRAYQHVECLVSTKRKDRLSIIPFFAKK